MFDVVRREARPLTLTPYLILGFVALLLALLVRAPASLLQKALPPTAPVQVTAWGGSLWNGQAEVLQAGEPAFWRWHFLPAGLVRARLSLQVEAQGALDLRGRLERGPGGWLARDLDGAVPSHLLQSMLPPGWTLPGEIRLEGVTLARQGMVRGPWREAAGQMRWGGGAMQYNLGSQVQAATLPEVVAVLRLEGDGLEVSLVEAASGGALADVTLAADGGVETRLRERLLQYAGRTSGASPDAVVVTSAQHL